MRARSARRHLCDQPCAQQQRHCNNGGGFHVNLTLPVVIQGRSYANGRQQHSEASARCEMLIEARPVDQRRNDNHASTNAEQSREHAREP